MPWYIKFILATKLDHNCYSWKQFAYKEITRNNTIYFYQLPYIASDEIYEINNAPRTRMDNLTILSIT